MRSHHVLTEPETRNTKGNLTFIQLLQKYYMRMTICIIQKLILEGNIFSSVQGAHWRPCVFRRYKSSLCVWGGGGGVSSARSLLCVRRCLAKSSSFHEAHAVRMLDSDIQCSCSRTMGGTLKGFVPNSSLGDAGAGLKIRVW